MDALRSSLMQAPGSRARAYSRFKTALFVLLAWNTGVFVYSGTFSEGLDSIAWLVLLALFELETGAAAPRKQTAVIHAARFVAAIAIPVAAVGYVLDREWLDTVNSVLWIAVVAVLEFQVRFRSAAARYRALSTLIATVLYAGLGAVALIWLWRADWFSAYDALLWLLAFVTIEINVLQVLRAQSATARAAAAGF